MLFILIIPLVVFFVGSAIVWRSAWASEEALHIRIFRRFVGFFVFASIACFFVLPVVILSSLVVDCVVRSHGIETPSDGYYCGETD